MLWGALLLFLLVTPPARGQQSVPTQQNPGMLLPGQSRQNVPPPSGPAPSEEVPLEMPEQRQSAAPTQSAAFPIRQVNVVGATLIPKEEIDKLKAPYEGRMETLPELARLADAITMKYRQRGYLTAEAFIPPQDIVGGVMRIQVQEGFVGHLSVEGNRFYRTWIIQRGVTLKTGDPLDFRLLERDLNRMNRFNDGYKAKAFLSAGTTPGETNIKLRVVERQPFQISGLWNNQGRPFIGLYRGGVEFRDDSLLTLGDRLYGQWQGSSGVQIGQASYSFPLHRSGTMLSAGFAFSRVNVTLPIDFPPEILGKAYTTNLTLSQPLDPDRRWTADIEANWQRISSYFNQDKTEYTDIRSLQTGISYDRPDRWGRTFHRVQQTFGIGGIGGTSRFWKVEDYFQRLFVLPKDQLLILRAYAQMTPDGLPASQQMQIGGMNSVRGYREGLLAGDRGFNVGLEHRFPVPFLKRISPWLSQRIQLAWFYDYGRVWLDRSNDNYIKSISDLPERTLLHSAGCGVRAQLTRFLQGSIDAGFGLVDRKNVEAQRMQPTARVHFSLRTNLLPENYFAWNVSGKKRVRRRLGANTP